MANYKNSKIANYSTYPIKAVDSASFPRVEPVIDAKKFKSRFMFGVPLASPITGEVMTDEMIEDRIIESMNLIEMECKIDIAPVKRKVRLPFAKDLYEEFFYVEIPNRPVLSIDKLAVTSPDRVDIYIFPPNWIDDANFIDGRVNVLPLAPGQTTAYSQPYNTSSAAGAFLLALSIAPNTPVFWEVDFTSGFDIENSGVPANINRMIGLKCAINIFNLLIPQFQNSSYSLGLDGVSQSQTTQAPQLYAQIRDQYIAEYDKLKDQVKMMYNNSLVMGMV